MRKLSLLLVIVVGLGLQGCTVGRAQRCYDETETLYVEKLEISKRDLGEEHPNTLMHMTKRIWQNPPRRARRAHHRYSMQIGLPCRK